MRPNPSLTAAGARSSLTLTSAARVRSARAPVARARVRVCAGTRACVRAYRCGKAWHGVPIVCLPIWHWYMLRGDWLKSENGVLQ